MKSHSRTVREHPLNHTNPHTLSKQPSMHVFGLEEETRLPRGNPCSMGRTCILRACRAEMGIEPPTQKMQGIHSIVQFFHHTVLSFIFMRVMKDLESIVGTLNTKVGIHPG